MSNQLDKIFKKNMDFPWQTINGETIIVDPNSQNSFELNEVGSFIWKRLDGKTSLKNICLLLSQEYDVDPETIQGDLAELVQAMESSQLIQVSL